MQVGNVISYDLMDSQKTVSLGKYSDLLMVPMPIFQMMLTMMLTIIDIGCSMFVSGIFGDCRADYQFGVRWVIFFFFDK